MYWFLSQDNHPKWRFLLSPSLTAWAIVLTLVSVLTQNFWIWDKNLAQRSHFSQISPKTAIFAIFKVLSSKTSSYLWKSNIFGPFAGHRSIVGPNYLKVGWFSHWSEKNALKVKKSWIWRQGPKVFLLPPGFDIWLLFPWPFVVILNYCWIQRIVLSLKGFIAVLLFLVRWPLLILTGFCHLRASLANFIGPIMSEIDRFRVCRSFWVPST